MALDTMTKDIVEGKIDGFLKELEGIRWLKYDGEESDSYRVVNSFTEAWDGWNDKMLKVWLKESEKIEKFAIESIGDEAIDLIFSRIAEVMGPIIEEGLVKFKNILENQGGDSDTYGLDYEIIEFIKRDIAWACVEKITDNIGFFNKVLGVLVEGRWACAWEGNYPAGRFVVM
ncbi:hypothetical protein [Clostridium gasigenes]|uniref:hypothetical protein n=1 Tax=Clostridium gasigenes TaxID=94869 RepID=UPI001C0B9C32|nr:hypothetical protein [Clostridium gasigenes]MBU3104292.1 hypothetical protein [Clostridium gasigenes]